MTDINLQSALKTDKGADFIAFCIERLKINSSVQAIWNDWKERCVDANHV